jgi:SAM-dependent methyltransferase
VTTEEAAQLIRGAVLDPDGEPAGREWADLGAGSGTFSFALAELLGDGAEVLAVDREEAALASLRGGIRARSGRAGARVIPLRADFRDLGGVEALTDRVLDGALFANALHFDPDAGRTLSRVAARLSPGGRLVVVEYQDRPPNPWVPHPLPVARLEAVAREQGLGTPDVVGERPSSYGGFLYCAVLMV